MLTLIPYCRQKAGALYFPHGDRGVAHVDRNDNFVRISGCVHRKDGARTAKTTKAASNLTTEWVMTVLLEFIGMIAVGLMVVWILPMFVGTSQDPEQRRLEREQRRTRSLIDFAKPNRERW